MSLKVYAKQLKNIFRSMCVYMVVVSKLFVNLRQAGYVAEPPYSKGFYNECMIAIINRLPVC